MQTCTQTQTFTGRHTTHIHTYAYTQFLREKKRTGEKVQWVRVLALL